MGGSSGPEGRQEVARSVRAGCGKIKMDVREVRRTDTYAVTICATEVPALRAFGKHLGRLGDIPRPDGRGYYLPALRASQTNFHILVTPTSRLGLFLAGPPALVRDATEPAETPALNNATSQPSQTHR